MKKLWAIAALLISASVAAEPNDLLINQRDNMDASTKNRAMNPPGGGGQDGIMGYKGSTNLPVFFSLGQGLSLTGSVLSASGAGGGSISWSAVTDKPAVITGIQAALDSKFPVPTGTTAQYLRADGTVATFPTTLAPSAHTQPWSTITATPTTLGGYGISDAATSAQLAAKFNTPTGTTAQYVRGDGTLATLPTAKRIETYAGVTDANGLYTVTYPTAFSAVPNVQPGPPSSSTQSWILVSSTITGFSVRLVQREVLTVLSVQVLGGLVSNVPSAPAQVLVVAQ